MCLPGAYAFGRHVTGLKGKIMNPDDTRKRKNHPQAGKGLKEALEGVLERLREELDELAQGLRPRQPQPVPIPVPVRRPGRR